MPEEDTHICDRCPDIKKQNEKESNSAGTFPRSWSMDYTYSPANRQLHTYKSADDVCFSDILEYGSLKPGTGKPKVSQTERALYRNLAKRLPRVRGLTFDGSQIRWISYWRNPQGKQVQKHFPVSKYGFNEARKLALCFIKSQEAADKDIENSLQPYANHPQEDAPARAVLQQEGDTVLDENECNAIFDEHEGDAMLDEQEGNATLDELEEDGTLVEQEGKAIILEREGRATLRVKEGKTIFQKQERNDEKTRTVTGMTSPFYLLSQPLPAVSTLKCAVSDDALYSKVDNSSETRCSPPHNFSERPSSPTNLTEDKHASLTRASTISTCILADNVAPYMHSSYSTSPVLTGTFATPSPYNTRNNSINPELEKPQGLRLLSVDEDDESAEEGLDENSKDILQRIFTRPRCPGVDKDYTEDAKKLPKIKGVHFDSRQQRWCAYGGRKKECFSVYRYGFEKARELALESRRKTQNRPWRQETSDGETEARNAVDQEMPDIADLHDTVKQDMHRENRIEDDSDSFNDSMENATKMEIEKPEMAAPNDGQLSDKQMRAPSACSSSSISHFLKTAIQYTQEAAKMPKISNVYWHKHKLCWYWRRKGAGYGSSKCFSARMYGFLRARKLAIQYGKQQLGCKKLDDKERDNTLHAAKHTEVPPKLEEIRRDQLVGGETRCAQGLHEDSDSSSSVRCIHCIRDNIISSTYKKNGKTQDRQTQSSTMCTSEGQPEASQYSAKRVIQKANEPSSSLPEDGEKSDEIRKCPLALSRDPKYKLPETSPHPACDAKEHIQNRFSSTYEKECQIQEFHQYQTSSTCQKKYEICEVHRNICPCACGINLYKQILPLSKHGDERQIQGLEQLRSSAVCGTSDQHVIPALPPLDEAESFQKLQCSTSAQERNLQVCNVYKTEPSCKCNTKEHSELSASSSCGIKRVTSELDETTLPPAQETIHKEPLASPTENEEHIPEYHHSPLSSHGPKLETCKLHRELPVGCSYNTKAHSEISTSSTIKKRCTFHELGKTSFFPTYKTLSVPSSSTGDTAQEHDKCPVSSEWKENIPTHKLRKRQSFCSSDTADHSNIPPPSTYEMLMTRSRETYAEGSSAVSENIGKQYDSSVSTNEEKKEKTGEQYTFCSSIYAEKEQHESRVASFLSTCGVAGPSRISVPSISEKLRQAEGVYTVPPSAIWYSPKMKEQNQCFHHSLNSSGCEITLQTYEKKADVSPRKRDAIVQTHEWKSTEDETQNSCSLSYDIQKAIHVVAENRQSAVPLKGNRTQEPSRTSSPARSEGGKNEEVDEQQFETDVTKETEERQTGTFIGTQLWNADGLKLPHDAHFFPETGDPRIFMFAKLAIRMLCINLWQTVQKKETTNKGSMIALDASYAARNILEASDTVNGFYSAEELKPYMELFDRCAATLQMPCQLPHAEQKDLVNKLVAQLELDDQFCVASNKDELKGNVKNEEEMPDVTEFNEGAEDKEVTRPVEKTANEELRSEETCEADVPLAPEKNTAVLHPDSAHRDTLPSFASAFQMDRNFFTNDDALVAPLQFIKQEVSSSSDEENSSSSRSNFDFCPP